jgi:hypothetical protein
MRWQYARLATTKCVRATYDASMGPIMNPASVKELSIENTSIRIPPALLYAGFLSSSIAPSNTSALKTSTVAVRPYRTVGALADPGSVGMIQGNQVVAAPRRAMLPSMRMAAIRGRVRALVDLSLWRVHLHVMLGSRACIVWQGLWSSFESCPSHANRRLPVQSR